MLYKIASGASALQLFFIAVSLVILTGVFSPRFAHGAASVMNVAVIDPTPMSASGVELSRLDNFVHKAIRDRASESSAWGQVFGGSLDRDAEKGAVAYSQNQTGVVFGYTWDNVYPRLGVLAGVAYSEIDSVSFDTETNYYYAGGYSYIDVDNITFTFSLIGGFNDTDTMRRAVQGTNMEPAIADYGSWFISPAMGVHAAYPLEDGYEFRPSANINYGRAWQDDYTGGGSSVNLRVDDRQVGAFSASVQVAGAHLWDQGAELELRVGYSHRYTDVDDATVFVDGQAMNLRRVGRSRVSGSYTGLNFSFAAADNVILIGDVEYRDAQNEDQLSGSLGFVYKF